MGFDVSCSKVCARADGSLGHEFREIHVDTGAQGDPIPRIGDEMDLPCSDGFGGRVRVVRVLWSVTEDDDGAYVEKILVSTVGAI